MDELTRKRYRADVAGKGAEAALKHYQANVNSCVDLSTQMSNLTSTFEQQKNALGQRLQKAERDREQARLELEIANDLHEEMKAAADTEVKVQELRQRGVRIE